MLNRARVRVYAHRTTVGRSVGTAVADLTEVGGSMRRSTRRRWSCRHWEAEASRLMNWAMAWLLLLLLQTLVTVSHPHVVVDTIEVSGVML